MFDSEVVYLKSLIKLMSKSFFYEFFGSLSTLRAMNMSLGNKFDYEFVV